MVVTSRLSPSASSASSSWLPASFGCSRSGRRRGGRRRGIGRRVRRTNEQQRETDEEHPRRKDQLGPLVFSGGCQQRQANGVSQVCHPPRQSSRAQRGR